MPTVTDYPGVYIEEMPSSVRTITGVSTSVTAFIGKALQGPVNKATLVHSFPEYQRIFGGLWKESTMSYSVYLYFQNGGTDAVIVRVHNGGKMATFAKDGTPASPLAFEASNPGTWANEIELVIDREGILAEKVEEDKDPSYFNMYVKDAENGTILESYLNLSLKADSPRAVNKVLEAESSYVRVSGAMPLIKEADYDKVKGTYAAKGGSDGLLPLKNEDIVPTTATPEKAGLYALDDADMINLLCIPSYVDDNTASTVYTAALDYCEKRRAMLIVDPPANWNNKDMPRDKTKGIEKFGVDRHRNAAIFFPRIKIVDPNDGERLRTIVPCGAIAGVIARTDSQRGVWKSPAGIEATLRGVADLEVNLTDKENGELNPLGINCLRVMGVAGRVVWGARTMRGADGLTDQWKYLSVRRMALYIEESLYRGTQWVVFEPNDEPLWSQIRLNIGAFMHDLFRKGAFQGSTPKEAYLVKCDKETTTQYDIDRGIVNIIVGFAPLKPAEFVIIKIQQLAGQKEEA
jgi:phage tail sheath protein FI